MKGFFITGTDTGVGKTFVTALITKALRAKNLSALAFKPMLCGERTDAEILTAANQHTLSIDEVNPIWLQPPLSPYAACVVEDRPFDRGKLREHWQNVTQQHKGLFLVEGVGGWLVPIDQQMTVGDWAVELGLPVIIVCRAGLGTINHTRLTIESIQRAGLPISGIFMNFHQTPDDLSSRTNAAILEQLCGLPICKVESEGRDFSLPDWLIFDQLP